MKKYPLNRFMLVLLVLSITLAPVACGSDDSDPVVTTEDPKPDPTNANTTIEANSPVIADGTATSNVTVTLADTDGKRFTSSGGTVALSSTGSASISAVTDNDNGTYAATVTNTTAETVTISGTLGGSAISDTAEITFDPEMVPEPDATQSTIEATSPVIPDGMATSDVTITLIDTEGNPFTTSGGTVALTTTGSALISSVTDNSDGTYSATITNTTAEIVTVSGTLDGTDITDTAEISFESVPDPSGSTIEATSPILADGTATSTVTITLVDTEGNPFTTSGGTITLMSTGSASISSVTDNGNGTYAATVTNTTAETVTISGSLDGIDITDTAEITFDPVPPVIAINAGGEEVIIDAVTFEKDTLFTMPSQTFSNTMIADIMGTEADTLYVTERIRGAGINLGTFGYSIPVDNGTYEVKLHFAELYWGLPGGGAAGGIGSRIFDVSIEDVLVLDDYDIFAEVGAATATIKVYESMVTDGILNIVLTASVDQPKISALEVIKKIDN